MKAPICPARERITKGSMATSAEELLVGLGLSIRAHVCAAGLMDKMLRRVRKTVPGAYSTSARVSCSQHWGNFGTKPSALGDSSVKSLGLVSRHLPYRNSKGHWECCCLMFSVKGTYR